jgi:hypothetical protein
MELQITKEELVEKLQNESVSVTFTKADGSERTMLCTKMITKIPEAHHPRTDSLHLQRSHSGDRPCCCLNHQHSDSH